MARWRSATGSCLPPAQRRARTLDLTIGAAELELPAPAIKEAPNNISLDPLAAENTLTAVVPQYAGMQATDLLSVTWSASAGVPAEGSHTTPAVPVGTVGAKEIALPVSVVAFSLSKNVTVSYTVTRAGAPQTSEELPLSVLPLPDSALAPGRPKILEAANSGEGAELDLANVAAGGSVRVGVWPHIAVGQYVWLRLKGRKGDGAAHELTLWQAPGNQVTATWISQGYYSVTAPYSYLKDLGDNTPLELEFKVALGKGQQEAEAVAFPLRTYTVKAVPIVLSAPTVKEADPYTDTLNLIKPVNGVTVVVPQYQGMVVGDQVTLHWEGTAGAGSATQTKTVTTPGTLEFAIANATITPNHNRTVTIYYTIARLPGVRSDTRQMLIQSWTLTGTATFLAGTTTSYYTCTFPAEIRIPENLPVGSRIASSALAFPSGQTSVSLQNAQAIRINLLSAEPRGPDGTIFPTGIAGIGFRALFQRLEGEFPSVLACGPGLHADGGFGNGGTRATLEFVKTGEVREGSLALQTVLEWRLGANRLLFMGFVLANSVRFVIERKTSVSTVPVCSEATDSSLCLPVQQSHPSIYAS